jgi:type IV pilus assembly protein PilW
MNHIRRSSSLFIRCQHGLTLVEILVALVLSLLLIAGVIQLFIGSKQTYRFYDALSRLQENGRLALDAMAMDIRMAGYVPPGVAPPGQLPLMAGPQNAIATNGTDGNGNDDITVRWLDNGPNRRTYSIRPRTPGGAVPTCPTAGTSLFFQRQTDANPQELVEGVQAMQILYGVCNIDTDGDGNPDSVGAPPGYVTAANVALADWPNVCSVRIHLLLVSLENNIVTQPQTVFFPADTANAINPADRCLRQAFSTTVRIRNRMPLR